MAAQHIEPAASHLGASPRHAPRVGAPIDGASRAVATLWRQGDPQGRSGLPSGSRFIGQECHTATVYQEPGSYPTMGLMLVSSHRDASPGDCIRLLVEGDGVADLVRGSWLWLEHHRGDGWEMAYQLISGSTPADAPRWASYGLSGRAFVTLRGYKGTMPLRKAAAPCCARRLSVAGRPRSWGSRHR
jgi:hypothetical protein